VNARPLEVENRGRVYASREDIAMQSVQRLAEMECERIRTALTRCRPEELGALQGEYRAYAQVMKWLHEPLRETKPVDNR
jgi:hypothetical protein